MDNENQSQENKDYGRFSEKCEKKMLISLFHSQIIDVVQEYTYLGTRMSSSGNFSVSREHLKEKALHALFSLRRTRILANSKQLSPVKYLIL